MKKILVFMVFSLVSSFSSAAPEWWKGVKIISVGYFPQGSYWVTQVKIEQAPAGKEGTACGKITMPNGAPAQYLISAWETSPNATITPIRVQAVLTAKATESPVDLWVDTATCSPDFGIIFSGVIIN